MWPRLVKNGLLEATTNDKFKLVALLRIVLDAYKTTKPIICLSSKDIHVNEL